MALSSLGTTFTFPGITATYTSISVEDPEAEVVDMTTPSDPIGTKRMVATGDFTSPGRVRVDYIRSTATAAPLTMSGRSGSLVIAHSGVSVTKNAVLVSASTEMDVGSLVSGSLNFVLDHN